MSELVPVSPQEQAVSLTFSHLNAVEESANNLLALLPQMTDEQLVQTYQYSKTVGKHAWRIECAAHFEIVRRDERRDAKKAYIEQMAQEMGVSATTVYRNAQLHEMAERNRDVTPNVEDKSLYEEALRAKDKADEAIELIATKKANDPRYSTRQARHDVKALTQQQTPPEVLENLYWVSVGLDPEQRETLRVLCLLWGTDQQGVLKRALVECYARSQVIDIPQTPQETPARTEEQVLLLLRSAIRGCCETLPDGFTSDEVRDLCKDIAPKPAQIGAAFRAAERSGEIEATGETRKSARPEAKGRHVQVWRVKTAP